MPKKGLSKRDSRTWEHHCRIFNRKTKLEISTRVKHSTCKKNAFTIYTYVFMYIFLLFFNVYGFCWFKCNFPLLFVDSSSSAVTADHSHTCAALYPTIRTSYSAIYFTLKKRIFSINLSGLLRIFFGQLFEIITYKMY